MVLGKVYARPSNSESRLINVSARNHVGTGHRVLIGGFTITGTSPLTVLVRAIGPGLQKYGVTGRLQDPVVALYHGRRNWRRTTTGTVKIRLQSLAPVPSPWNPTARIQ
jgi:hypothetical protein